MHFYYISDHIPTDLTVKIDIWALGIIMYEWVYNEQHPYITIPGGKASKLIALSNLDVPVNLDPINDALQWDTMKSCLEKRHENRSDIQKLLRHPYLYPLPFHYE